MSRQIFDGYQEILYKKDTFFVEDDFDHYVTADWWSTVATDAGTITVSDAKAGIVTLDPSDGTVADNDETYLKGTTELFLVAAAKPIYAAAYLKFVEAATNAANICFGLFNAVAADLLVDNGAGLRTTGNYFAFFKVDGGTTWQVRSRNSTNTTTNDTGVTAGGSAYHTFEIMLTDEGAGTNVRATYKIDGQECRDASTLRLISHSVPVASSTEMQVGFGVKNGSGSRETLLVDWVYASQKR